MPLPPPDTSSKQRSIVMLESPRDAAKRAIVYRRGSRQKPREFWLRVIALVGAFLVHMVFLLSAILGSAYDFEQLQHEPKGTVLKVRLIDNKPVPPPPPIVLGALPKRHGPTHRGNSNPAKVTHVEPSTGVVVAAQQESKPAPTPPSVQTPIIAQAPTPTAPKKQRAAAPLPPLTVPKPAPAALPQITVANAPPQAVFLQAPPVPQPVPPKFQPEPVRKAQAEGTQAMPPPPSLATPTQPAQSAPTVTPLVTAVDNAVPKSPSPPSVAANTQPVPPAAPPAPQMQPIPLPAQAAPTVNLQPPGTTVTPVAPELRQVQAPAVQIAPPALSAVPPPSKAVAPEPAPATPAVPVETPKAAPAPASISPQPSVATTPTANAPEAKPSAPAPSSNPTSTASEQSKSEAATNNAASTNSTDVSTAPNATPQGSDTAKPGQPNGSQATSQTNGQAGGVPSLTQGQGVVPNGEGKSEGSPGSPGGTYIQLKPRGDTAVLSHNLPNTNYRPTVFDKYWTPKGESSVDTALRHAVEKTTVGHTFNLPRGVRVECVAMPLLPMALLGCHNPDPPAAALKPEIYKRLNLPTTSTVVPTVPAPAASQATASAVPLDNSVQCAEARVVGGPMPPDCASAVPVAKPLHLPTSSSSGSWVPASDQFH